MVRGKLKNNNVFSNYFDSNIKLLKLTGYWVYDDDNANISHRHTQHVYNIFWCTYLFLVYTPTEIFYTFFSFGDLNTFLRSLRDNGNHIALAYKAVNYYINRKDILRLINTLQWGDYSYEEYEDFKPELIAKEEKKQALNWTNYFWYFVNAICLCMFTTGLYTFLFLSDEKYTFQNGKKVYNQAQPVVIVSPFGSGTRVKFFVTFIHIMINLTCAAWMIVALDSLYITLMSCISAHLKILQGAFKTLRKRCLKRFKMTSLIRVDVLHDPETLQREMRSEMIKCMRHLQNVLSVAEKLESIYNVQTLFQSIISMGEMCFSLYLLSETTSQSTDQNLGNEITYLIATAFELLLYCWFGNRITEASNAIGYSLYDSDWFSTNLSFRKQIMFTISRMKRPIYVTMGKIRPLTFDTFLTIVRGAYSFFTFLKQRHGIRK